MDLDVAHTVCCSPVLETVHGLCWGDYLGSPSDVAEPKVAINEMIGAQRVVAITTEEIFGLKASSCVITHETKSGTCSYFASHLRLYILNLWLAGFTITRSQSEDTNTTIL